MQGFPRFPSKIFLTKLNETQQNKLYDILLNIDTQVRTTMSTQRVKQSVVSVEKTMPVVQRLELQSLEQIFGLEFGNEPINNTIQVCVINKIKLKDQINNSDQLDQNDKQMWLDQLDSPSCTEQTIENIKRSFESYVDKCNINRQITKAVNIVCKFAAKHYFNGERKLGNLTLPDMNGMQEDILQFFNHSYVQNQIDTSGAGKQLGKIVNNPISSLGWNLVMRGMKNKKEVVAEVAVDSGEISD